MFQSIVIFSIMTIKGNQIFQYIWTNHLGSCLKLSLIFLRAVRSDSYTAFEIWFTGRNSRSSRSEVFLVKSLLKICSKFTGEHPCRSVTSLKLLCNFIDIALPHRCSSVNLLHIFRTPFP